MREEENRGGYDLIKPSGFGNIVRQNNIMKYKNKPRQNNGIGYQSHNKQSLKI